MSHKNYRVFSVFISLLTTTLSQYDYHQQSVFKCTEEGFHLDPQNCRVYHRCVDWGDGITLSPFYFECAPGTVFSKTLGNICVHPDDSERQECRNVQNEVDSDWQSLNPGSWNHPDGGHTPTASDHSSLAADDDVGSPQCQEEGFIEDSDDCQKFHRCLRIGLDRYKKYKFSCGPGTVWDQNILGCNHPWAVSRDKCRMSPSNAPVQPEAVLRDSNQVEPLYSHVPQNSESTFGVITASTTPSSPRDLFPSESMKSINPTKSLYPKGSTTSTDFPVSGITEPVGTQSKNTVLIQNSACSEEGFFPDPQNCRKFYRCVMQGSTYVKFEFECGTGTGWDQGLQTCNHLYALPSCGSDNNVPGEANTGIPQTDDSSGNQIEDVNDNDPAGISTTSSSHLPPSTESSMSQLTMSIPLATSKIPEATAGTILATSGAPQQTPLTTAPSVSSSPINTLPATATHSSECQKDGFFPNPKDCRKFYRCVRDPSGFRRFDFDCGPGTAWDQGLQTCNYISQVVSCSSNNHEINDALTMDTQTPAAAGTTIPQFTSGVNLSPISENPNETTSHVDPISESSFTPGLTSPGGPSGPGIASTTSPSTPGSTSPGSSPGPNVAITPSSSTSGSTSPRGPVSSSTPESTSSGVPSGPDVTITATIPPSGFTSPDGPSGHDIANTASSSTPGSSSFGSPSGSGAEGPLPPSTPGSTSPVGPLTFQPNNGIVCTIPGFYANPTNCKKFYRCVDNGNGFNVYHFDCPTGTIFDPSISVCNYPESVYPSRNCDGQTIVSAGTPLTTTEKMGEPSVSTPSATTIMQGESSTPSGSSAAQSTAIEGMKSTTTPEIETTTSISSEESQQPDINSPPTTEMASGTNSDATTTVNSSEEGMSVDTTTLKTDDTPATTGPGSDAEQTTLSPSSDSTEDGDSATTTAAYQESITTPEQESTTITNQESTITDNQESTTSVNQESTTTANQESTTIANQESTTIANQESTTIANQESATTANQESPETSPPDPVTTTQISQSTTDQQSSTESQETTIASSTSASEPALSNCPVPANLTDDQIVLVCPTGFRRHPKFCNLIYQCTTGSNMEIKVLTLSCPENTMFDETKVQCLPEAQTSQPCAGSMANSRFYRQLESNFVSPIKLSSQQICPREGHYPYQEGCSNAFYKCKKNSIGIVEGYLYKCPKEFMYWSVSRRCERANRVPNCSRSVYPYEDISWERQLAIPVEHYNLSARKLFFR